MGPSEHVLRYSRRPDQLNGRKPDGWRAYGQTALLHCHQVGRSLNEFREPVGVQTIAAERADHKMRRAKP
jgi:hypothetical protein